ncbi:MAG: carbohydrate porin [Sphingomonadales bacterium]|nr:carbohydrate porin [Sphingomonadales bacterium]
MILNLLNCKILLACVTLSVLAIGGEAQADDGSADDAGRFAVHGQATFVLQGTPGFPSPYAGLNSLTPHQRKETIDATLYLGTRLWRGAELWVNPEIDQGFGLSNTLGAAGFPSAEAYKVGKKSPYFRLQRAFVRQTIDLGGDQTQVDGVANQFSGAQSANRIILTIGKFGVGDVFDTNRYAHDPRGDFLNWSVVDAGTFDYAADAWGYSSGVAAEWVQGAWTFRAGLFNLSKIPNGETLESGFSQRQIDGEVEHRHKLAGRDGAVRVTVFRNSGQFGRFDDALNLAAQTNAAPDTALVRSRKSRAGVHLNIEQAVTDDVGLFLRAGFADGSVEPYDFTDIDRTVQAGAAVTGKRWGRASDTIGVAAVVNAISDAHKRYLAAGGIGVLVGDGVLPHPGAEQIAEIYYRWKPLTVADLTLDYQHIANPGYNRDRGPANVFAVRVHGQF